MRHSTLCSGELRLEFYPDRDLAYATVSADGDFEDRPAVTCDPDALRAVLNGKPHHIAGNGWICSMGLTEGTVDVDLWRDGQKPKRCRVPVNEYEHALTEAFGTRSQAYAV
ncbi:MAG TPA: hypothetical protein VK934_05095 [Fimbriimonas sp.]|nr:hypothetical protein [Fimbriimonas sp.]